MNNHGNSVANTCALASFSGGAVFIRYKTNPLCGILVIHSNRTGRFARLTMKEQQGIHPRKVRKHQLLR